MLSASDEEDADEAAFRLVNVAQGFQNPPQRRPALCTIRASAAAVRNESHVLTSQNHHDSHNAKLTWISR